METARPWVMLSRFQSFWMVCSAPEITAVSSPKRKPLRATVNDQRRSLCLFIECAFLSFPDRLPLRIVMALRVCSQRKASGSGRADAGAQNAACRKAFGLCGEKWLGGVVD